HVLDAVDLLLERRRHRLGDHLRVRPRVGRDDEDGRGHDVGVLADGQDRDRDQPRDEDDDREDGGEDRPIDEEPGDVHGALTGLTGIPGAKTFCAPFTMTLSPAARPERTTRFPSTRLPTTMSLRVAVFSAPTT